MSAVLGCGEYAVFGEGTLGSGLGCHPGSVQEEVGETLLVEAEKVTSVDGYWVVECILGDEICVRRMKCIWDEKVE